MQKTIISKSAKRKMSSATRAKADAYTQQVVYKEKLSNGKLTSTTKHEKLFR